MGAAQSGKASRQKRNGRIFFERWRKCSGTLYQNGQTPANFCSRKGGHQEAQLAQGRNPAGLTRPNEWTENRWADGRVRIHPSGANSRLGHIEAEGAMEAIPPREYDAIVGVSFVLGLRMMNPMHARRDEQFVEPAFQPDGQPHVTVMNGGTGLKDRFVNKENHCRRPD